MSLDLCKSLKGEFVAEGLLVAVGLSLPKMLSSY